MSETLDAIVSADGLGQEQQAALAAVREGQTLSRSAEVAGVSRSTLYRWLQTDPHFRAAYNAWQQEMTESARGRLLKLADQAVDVIEAALRRSDEKVALGILKHVGALRRTGRGWTDPQLLGLKMKLDRDTRRRKLAEANLKHLLDGVGFTPEEQRAMIRRPPRQMAEPENGTLGGAPPGAPRELEDASD